MKIIIKRIFTTFMLGVVLITFIACNPVAGPRLANLNIDIRFTSITLEYQIEDEEELLQGTFSYIATNVETHNMIRGEMSRVEVDSRFDYTIVFRGLERDTKYSVKITANSTNNSLHSLFEQELQTLSGGSSAENAVEIKTPQDFKNMSRDSDAIFSLVNDLDFQGEQIKAEDLFGTTSTSTAFKGVFQGNGFTIKNLNIVTSSRVGNVGLFGFISPSNNIKNEVNISNLTLDNINVYATQYYSLINLGVLAGSITESASIENINIINSSVYHETSSSSQTESNVGIIAGKIEGYAGNINVENSIISVLATGIANFNIGGGFGSVVDGNNINQGGIKNLNINAVLNVNTTMASSQTKKITAYRIGGVIGFYNKTSLIENIASSSTINILNFEYIGSESDKTDLLEVDSLTLGGLIGLYASTHGFRVGYYNGIINISSLDRFNRIERFDISTLIGRIFGETAVDLIQDLIYIAPLEPSIINIGEDLNYGNVVINTNFILPVSSRTINSGLNYYGNPLIIVNGVTVVVDVTLELSNIDVLTNNNVINAFLRKTTLLVQDTNPDGEFGLQITLIDTVNALGSNLTYVVKENSEVLATGVLINDTIAHISLDVNIIESITLEIINSSSEIVLAKQINNNKNIELTDIEVRAGGITFNVKVEEELEGLYIAIFGGARRILKIDLEANEEKIVNFSSLTLETVYTIRVMQESSNATIVLKQYIFQTQSNFEFDIDGLSIQVSPTEILGQFNVVNHDDLAISAVKATVYENGIIAKKPDESGEYRGADQVYTFTDFDASQATEFSFNELRPNSLYYVEFSATLAGDSNVSLGGILIETTNVEITYTITDLINGQFGEVSVDIAINNNNLLDGTPLCDEFVVSIVRANNGTEVERFSTITNTLSFTIDNLNLNFEYIIRVNGLLNNNRNYRFGEKTFVIGAEI